MMAFTCGFTTDTSENLLLAPYRPFAHFLSVSEGSISSDNALPCTGCPGEFQLQPLGPHALFLSEIQQAKMSFSIVPFQKL